MPRAPTRGRERRPRRRRFGLDELSHWNADARRPSTCRRVIPARIFRACTGPARTCTPTRLSFWTRKTGSLRTWYQLVPHDVHDWDQSAAPALLTTKQGRKRAMAAGKAGFLHAIDIVRGKDRLEYAGDHD